jgi:hypothetical protein
MAWYLNTALTTYRNEVNEAYPQRDKASDGTIGDEAHQSGSSDHNPDSDGSVDAWDMDINLKGPSGGSCAAEIEELKALFQAHPASQYWIHNREIANRDYGWDRRYYDGSNAHDKHVHWNTRSSYEDSTQPWGVGEDMPSAEEIANAVVNKLMSADMSYHGQNLNYENLLRNIHEEMKTGKFGDWKMTQAFRELGAMSDPAADPAANAPPPPG